MAKSNRQLLITLGADTTTFSQKVKRAKDLTKELDSNFKLLSSSSKDFDKSIDGLAKKQDYLNDKIKVATTLNDVYNDRLADQQDRLNKSMKSMQGLEKELEDLKDVQKRSLDPAEWDAWQKEIDKVEDELKQVKKETKSFQDSVIGLNTAIDKNQTDIQKMNGELAETKIKFDMLSRDKTFEEMQKDINETEREFDNIKNSTDGFGRAISDLKAEKAMLNIQMKKTNELMSEYSVDIEKSTTEMKQMETKVESLTSELRAMERAVDGMDGTEKHYKEWSDEMDRLRAELTSSNRILEIHKNRVESLKNSYNQSENSLKSMEGSVKRVDNEIYNFGRKNNFKQIDNHLENLRHEFDQLGAKTELLRSKFMNFENSIIGAMRESKLLKEQTKNLKQQFEGQQRAINEYKLKIQELIVKKKELKQEIKELDNSLEGVDKNSPTFARTKSAMGELERSLKSVEDEIKDVDNELRQMELSSTNTLTSINNNIQGQARTWDVVADKIKSVGGAFQSIGGHLQSLGGAMMPLTASMTALGVGVVKTGANFEQSMSKVRALSGATDEQFKKLEKTARDLGRSTVFSATDASEGLQYLALAGYSVEDSMNALPIILDSAVAGAMELGTASDLATDVLSSLGENSEFTGDKIKDLDQLMNQVAKTSTKSNTSMQQLLEAYIKVGGQVENMNIPLSTANTMLGILADKGIKAEEAGNSLNSILINLTKTGGESAKAMKELGVSAFDSNGKIKPIEKTLGEMKKKLSGLSEQKQIQLINMIGGKTQAKTLQKLLQGIDADTQDFTEHYKGLRKEIEKSLDTKSLDTLRKTMEDNLTTDWKELESAVEEQLLTIFDGVAPQLRKIVQSITDVVGELTKNDTLTNVFSSILNVVQGLIDKFASLSPKMQENILKFIAWGAILAPIIMVLGGLFTGVGSIISVFGSLVGGTGKVVGGFNLLKQNGVKLSGFFTNFKGTVGKVASVLSTNLVGASAGASGALSGGLAGAVTALSSVALPALVIGLGLVATSLGENEDALTWLADKWGWFGEFVGGILERFSGFVQFYFGNILIFVQTLGKMLVKLVSGEWKDIDDAWDEGMAKIGVNTAKAMSNIAGESAGAIKYLREVSSKDIKEIGNIFEQTFEKLPNVTTKNVDKVAKDFTKMFSDSTGKVISISERNLEILRGTSDSMAVLFSGITAEMDAKDATELFKKNMETMITSGMTTADALGKDFQKAGELIEKNLVDGTIRAKENANAVLKEFSDIAKGDIDSGVNDIVGILQKLDTKGVETLRGMGTNWNAILGNINDSSKMSAEDMKNAILGNIERLGLDTPEKLQSFKDTLKTELDLATSQAGQDGQELGLELLEGVETGVDENAEGTGQAIQETTKNVTQKATEGAKQGFENLPESVRQELEKAGVSINEQGNVIVADMADKGKQGAKAYVDEMNAQLPALSGVAGTIQDQLNGINSVRFGGVTKQLSEINRWLGLAKDSAIKTGASLAEITTISFGSSSNGLKEINKWLKDDAREGKNVKNALKEIVGVTFGSTTKGLSEVNKWLRDNIIPNATTAHSKLLTLSRFTFSGVISGLKSVNSWLNTIKNTAGTTRSALLSVAQAKASGASFVGGEPIPDFSTQTYDMNKFARDSIKDVSMANFKTTGGFYEPQPIVLPSAEPIKTSATSDALLKATLEQNQLLLQLLNQQKPVEVAVNMDGRQVAKASAKYMESEINMINSRKNRLGGK